MLRYGTAVLRFSVHPRTVDSKTGFHEPLTQFDEALRELKEPEESPVLRRRSALERGEGDVHHVLGGEDDEVAHLAAVGSDLGRVLIGPVVDRQVVERAAGTF